MQNSYIRAHVGHDPEIPESENEMRNFFLNIENMLLVLEHTITTC